MSTAEQTLRSIIVKQLKAAKQLEVEAERVTLDTTLEELGHDSLSSVEVIMAIEEEFGVTIPEEELANLDTLRKTLAYIEAHTG